MSLDSTKLGTNAHQLGRLGLRPSHGRPEEPSRAEFDAEVLVVLRRLLAIPHDACRESALHGIGHWADYYPSAASIVDDFLANTSGLRPELVSYALGARIGGVL